MSSRNSKKIKRKVFITGGTGFVGSNLAARLIEQGDAVTVLTRAAPRAGRLAGVSYLQGNPLAAGPWQDEVRDHDIVINLAGTSIFTLWTEKQKRLIRESRILTTGNLVAAMPARQEGGRRVLLSASGVGHYGFAGDRVVTEEAKAGDDFLARLTCDWEGAAMGAATKGVRVVLCRFGVVLEKNGGALAKMLPVFKLGLGGALGSGQQWFSWIHIQDLVDIMLFFIDNQELSGPVNCTAPNPVTNLQLTRDLGQALHRPLFMPPVPAPLLRLLLGEFSSLLLEGQRAVPAKLLASNFSFRYPLLSGALADLVKGR